MISPQSPGQLAAWLERNIPPAPLPLPLPCAMCGNSVPVRARYAPECCAVVVGGVCRRCAVEHARCHPPRNRRGIR